MPRLYSYASVAGSNIQAGFLLHIDFAAYYTANPVQTGVFSTILSANREQRREFKLRM